MAPRCVLSLTSSLPNARCIGTTANAHYGSLAQILALEHRFYGESIPNGNLETDNYRFLTVEQALADLKHFREAYQQSMYPSTANKWIAIGGSYPGALAAWFRVAYPDTTVASLSSSGVVDPVYAFDAFDEQVALAAGPTCANALRKTTAAFEAEIARGNGTHVKALLGAQDLNDADFHYMIADSAAMAVQYGHKNVLCDHMVRALDAKEPLPEAFANFTITMYGPDFGRGCFYDTACLVNDRSRWADVRSWRWQKCAQLAYFQVAPKTQSLRSSIVDLRYHEEQCRAVFGDAIDTRAGVAAVKQRYGGAKPRGHKIFFSNGGDDPWQRASVLTSLSDDEVANLAQCDLCGHCGDLRADPDSPAPLKKQRDEILKYLTKWLAESDAAAPAVVPSSVQSDAALLPDTVAGTTTESESEGSYRTSPFVLVPIVVAFVAFVGVLHKDFVRDARPSSRAGYERLTGV